MAWLGWWARRCVYVCGWHGLFESASRCLPVAECDFVFPATGAVYEQIALFATMGDGQLLFAPLIGIGGKTPMYWEVATGVRIACVVGARQRRGAGRARAGGGGARRRVGGQRTHATKHAKKRI